MATVEQTKKDNQDFGDAYNEDTPEQAAQTDDDAFGLTIPTEEADYPQSPEEAIEADPAEGMDTSTAPSEQEMKLKAWEHQLMMREQALSGRDSGQGDDALNGEAEESPEEEGGESGLEESGEQALKQLADDFGDDFAKLISLVIDARVKKSQSNLTQSIDEIINDIVDTKTRSHFEAIAARHPDFAEIDKSPEFAQYLASMPPEATQVAQTGNAADICKLLDDYKASTGQSKQPTRQAPNVDAAEGVRSSGMRLPTQPGANSDYAAAWEEFD